MNDDDDGDDDDHGCDDNDNDHDHDDYDGDSGYKVDILYGLKGLEYSIIYIDYYKVIQVMVIQEMGN